MQLSVGNSHRAVEIVSWGVRNRSIINNRKAIITFLNKQTHDKIRMLKFEPTASNLLHLIVCLPSKWA